MLLGVFNVEENELIRHVNSKDEFYAYCDSLVPKEFRHCKEILNNQRYLCTLILRKSKKVGWDIKKDLIISILSEVRVVGLTDSCIEVSQLYLYISKKDMEEFRRREICR